MKQQEAVDVMLVQLVVITICFLLFAKLSELRCHSDQKVEHYTTMFEGGK
jgi:hypothetical protein